jgi:hypothetical protein
MAKRKSYILNLIDVRKFLFCFLFLFVSCFTNGKNTNQYSYDNENRIIKASYSPDCRFVKYGYENDGNRIFQNEHYLNISSTLQNVDCTNPYGGSISLNTSVPGLSYQWSNGEFGPSISNLSTGHYTVTIIESALGNVCYQEYDIYNTSTTSVPVVTTQDVTCQSSSNGAATVSVINGTGPYIYQWSTGQTDSSITGLGPGNYSVTVTDITINCVQQVSFTIASPPSVILGFNLVSPQCNGNNNGTIQAQLVGATSNYSNIHWSNGQTGVNAINLAAGTYIFYATDSLLCTNFQSVVLPQPNILIVPVSTTDVSCHSINDGTAFAQTGGGTTPYSYSMDGITYSTNPIFLNLSTGSYTMYCLDSHGCTVSNQFSVNQMIANNGLPVNVTGDTLLISPYTNAGSTWYEVGNPNPLGVGFQFVCHSTSYYYTIGYDQNFCQATSANTLACIDVSTNEINKPESIVIYPNPNSGIFNILIPSHFENNFTISILDVLSREIFFKNASNLEHLVKIDLSNLPKAEYFILIRGEKTNYVSKIIID